MVLIYRANCTVNGANPRSVTVAFGATVTVAFEVACTEVPLPAGKIVFHSDRDGDFEIYSIDPDGSSVILYQFSAPADLQVSHPKALT